MKKNIQCHLGNITIIDTDVRQLRNIEVQYQSFDLAKQCAEHIKSKNPVMIDGGANPGLFSFSMIQLIPSINIIAFEAQSYLASLVSESIQNNNFNIDIRNNALSNDNNLIKVPVFNYDKPGSFGSVSLNQNNPVKEIKQDKPVKHEIIKSIKIDDLNLSELDFVKLDIEGMEVEALKGGLETIKKFKPSMLIEHKKCIKKNIYKFFERYNLNYDTTEIGADILCIAK